MSTANQDPTPQLVALRDLAAQRGWEGRGEYIDYASGRQDRRPDLDRLLREMRAGEVVTVVRLDRLARSTKHLLELAEGIKARGVDLVVKDQQGMDTTTPAGQMIFTVLGAVAQFEADLISARTKEALAVARTRLQADGRNLGRPPKIIPLVLAEMVTEGLSLSAMAKRLRVAKATVRKWLARMNGQKTGHEVGR